ncbi:Transcriptional regulator, MarR family [Candidatus Rhodobacter oscarellae]|uniref:Transcriptional regulator, MarR family n=1 Tax=Candidatus Rhodobacter oscarellae TaxID=1675527 RepID=A0A0J9EDD3_9RHOB|nr:MarR family transcriptional regulator [Candidatus Rhodobacter lobularis]KMW60676.1 Transcriptional regulator, MarR family [Candidatus Rhodobacter lobularis]
MTRFTDDYLLFLLAQASARASAAFHAHLAERSVKVATWRILATLYPDAPATIGELAASCMTKQPTMTRQVDRLERAGLVERRASAGDRRRVLVSLSASGRALADALTQLARAHEAKVLAAYTGKQQEELKALLAALPPD